MSSPFYYKQVEYTDKKGEKKTKRDETAAPVLNAKLIYSEKSKNILSLFKTKGKKDLNPFKYLEQYCHVLIALVIEGIFISKSVEESIVSKVWTVDGVTCFRPSGDSSVIERCNSLKDCQEIIAKYCE